MRSALERKADTYAKLFADFVVLDPELALRRLGTQLEVEPFFRPGALTEDQEDTLFKALASRLSRKIVGTLSWYGDFDDLPDIVGKYAQAFAGTLVGWDTWGKLGRLIEDRSFTLPPALWDLGEEIQNKLMDVLSRSIVEVVYKAGFGGRKRWGLNDSRWQA